MNLRTLTMSLVATAAMMQLTSCGTSTNMSRTAGETGSDVEIVADAYLFDTKLYRDGSPTSIRLELFQTDSVIGLGGRAYLGKGALKGRLVADSLKVYFPSSNEFVQDALADILATSECPIALGELSLMRLFETTPDSLEMGQQLEISADWTDKDRPAFVITKPDCRWRIEVDYDRHDDLWRVERYRFESGDESIILRGDRREYKSDVTITASKFDVTIPDDAVRIIP